MKSSLFAGILLAWVAVAASPADAAPTVLRDGELGTFSRVHRTDIAASGETWFITAAVTMPDAANPLAKVYLWRSTDGGKAWSAPEPLSDGPFEETCAGLCLTEKGTLLVNYSTSLAWALEGEITDPALRAWWEKTKETPLAEVHSAVNFWMRRSTDGGVTWSAPYEIPCNPLDGALALGEGSLSLFGHRVTDSIRQMIGGERNNFILSNAVSTDDGQSWQRVKDLGAVEGAGLVADCLRESGSAAGRDGGVAVFLRNPYSPGQAELKCFEISRAEPNQWTSQQPAGEAAAFHVTSLPKGGLLLSYLEAKGDRSALHARISNDGGTTWKEAGAIADRGGTIHPGFSSAVLEDGSVVTVWLEERAPSAWRLRYRLWKP